MSSVQTELVDRQSLPSEGTSQIALVISSCDDFCDTWRPFTFFLAKFWPDCPFDTFLITNEQPVLADLFKPIPVGLDRGWASNFRLALTRVPHEYVLYLQDDYFLEAPVNTARVVEDCAWCIMRKVDSLCFAAYPEPQPGYVPVTERFGRAPLDSDGRTRCQFSLWKKNSLLEVLREGETAWEMESRGSERTRDMEIMLYACRSATPVRYLSSAIVRGLWVPEALQMCRAAGVPIAPRLRAIYRRGQQFKKVRRMLSRYALRRWLKTQKGKPLDLRRAQLLQNGAGV